MDGQEVCHVLAMRLQAEHRQWDAKVQAIDSSLTLDYQPLNATRRINELCSQLQTLRAELHQHFEEEAEGGCLEEAACRCPSLSTEALRIEHDHPRLLGRLDRIIDAAWSRDDSAALAGMLRQFNQELRELANAEQLVVQHGLNVNLDLD